MTVQYDFKGRHAVITGGASGIGFAIAQRMVASGATVTLWDRDAQALSRAASQLGAAAKTVQLDLAEHPQVVTAVATTLAHSPTKTIDILVNSAGITGPNDPLAEYSIDAWHEVIQINMNAVFYCCREIVPVMKANNDGKGYGRIVNIASIAAKEGNPNASAYGASKAGVLAMSKSLSKELAATGIRINSVTPATVKSPIFSQMKPEFIQYMLAKIPMGRFGEVEEVAAMVMWLASEDCSFSTGAVFDISGGRATY